MDQPRPPKSLLARVVSILRTLVLTAIALAALGFFLAWMGGAFHEKVQPGHVEVERPSAEGRTIVAVEKSTVDDQISAVGTVQSRRRTDVASQILTGIREIKVRAGDTVKEGEPLVILDDRDLQAQQREATAALATAQADLVTRKDDYERNRKLRTGGSISADEFNRIEGAFKIAETQVQRARETISRTEVLLTYTKISANTNGLVADRFAEPGDLAMPGKPILSIYDPNNLELHANVPESIAAGLALGQKLNLNIEASNLKITAEVREIVPQAQQASRSVIVKLALPVQSNRPILPGMFGRVTIPVGRSEQIQVPSQAIQRIGQLDLVEVVDADNKLNRRFVRIGREFDGKTEILSGLSAGERVALPKR